MFHMLVLEFSACRNYVKFQGRKELQWVLSDCLIQYLNQQQLMSLSHGSENGRCQWWTFAHD